MSTNPDLDAPRILDRLAFGTAGTAFATWNEGTGNLDVTLPDGAGLRVNGVTLGASSGGSATAATPATLRAPTTADNADRGWVVGDLWLDHNGITWQAQSVAGLGLWTPLSGIPKRPLDGVTAPAVAYGTRRLLTSWSGYALTLTRDSDSATLDVGFLADDTIDAAAADNFCAGTVGRITKVYDQTGGGNHATAATGTAPVWDSTKLINGNRVLSFQSIKHDVSGGGPSASNQYLVIPSGVTWNPVSCTWLMVLAHNNPGTRTDQGGLLTNAAGTTGWLQSYNDGQGVRGLGLAGTAETHVTTNPSVLCVACGASFFRVYQNGDYENVNHPNSASSGTGGNIGWASATGGAVMSLGAFALWTSQLSTNSTQPDVIKNFERAFRVQRQFDHLVVVIAASDGAGTANIAGSSWPFELGPLLRPGCRVINNSSHGIDNATAYSDRATMLGAAYTRHRGATARTVVVVYTPAGNDIASGISLADLKAATQSYVAYAKGLGSNVKVVLSTKYMQERFEGLSSELAVLQGYNEWLAASYRTAIADGGAGADGLADQFASPLISNGGYVSSLLTGAVSWDGVHLRALYQSSVAPLYAEAINGVLN